MICYSRILILWVLMAVLGGGATAACYDEVEEPLCKQAVDALDRAIHFFHKKVAVHGGYVWKYSSDLEHRQGEGLAYDERIWVQPPGTPTVGMAFLQAYEASGNPEHLRAARDAADALVNGQLHSGGWPYSITFDPHNRRQIHYRKAPARGKPIVEERADEPGGWEVWRPGRYPSNMTLLDDDTTQSALRFLMRVDQMLKFENNRIHEAVQYGLASLMNAQYPIGAWSHNYDRYPTPPPSPGYYPVQKASYPEEWSRNWTKDFSGCYHLNDRITLNCITTLLEAYEVYGDRTYWGSALRGGDFLLLAQMPDPQPAWAQQYDRQMQPVWDRSFEPPSITGLESQDVLETLLLLYERTGKERFLKAVPRALVYLRNSELEDGKLARFYELKTNRPLYFTKEYELTHDRGQMPSHYQFVVNSRLEALAFQYRLLAAGEEIAAMQTPTKAEQIEEVRRVLDAMDDRGVWPEPGWVRDEQGRKIVPPNGILLSSTFAKNIEILSRWIRMCKGP